MVESSRKRGDDRVGRKEIGSDGEWGGKGMEWVWAGEDMSV